MENKKKIFETLISETLRSGAYKAEIIYTSEIKTDRYFRRMCVSNACGMYGRCYTCPPDAGDIDELVQEVTNYKYALVYQTVSALEDGYDFEGMIEGKKASLSIAKRLRSLFLDINIMDTLHLGAGGCGICEQCAKITEEPCRFPSLAMSSLEAYGINVSELANSAGMKYINGQDTVTYFGAVLFSLDSEEIKVTVNGTKVIRKANTVLSEIISGEMPCGGHGKCGKCKVAVKGKVSKLSKTELELLSSKELENGIRLACLTYAIGDCEVKTIDNPEKMQVVTEGKLPEMKINPMFANYGVALDIGTTTIAARLYDKKGNLLSQTATLNPQQEWGADVISRIEAAIDGKAEQLALSVKKIINYIISDLARIAKIDTKQIDGLVITGNTVMLSLLTGQSTEPFSHAPFDVKRLFGETLKAEQLDLFNLSSDALVYLPRCISAFVGADITCAILATKLCEDKTALLVDIGTNGEMALWHNGKLTVCSTAAGPAFEGVGISMGMRGAAGAVDMVKISGGILQAHTIGDSEPIGICGSGLIDSVACMLELGVIDESGYLEDECFLIKEPVLLTQNDIRMVQLAKSAIFAGIMTILQNNELSPYDVSILYIAGGFGNYLNMESAAKIGLLPQQLANDLKNVGNASLVGASMILLSIEQKMEAEEISKSATTLELSTSKSFSDYYISGMIFE